MKKIIIVLFSFLFVACASTPKTNSSQVSQPKETISQPKETTNSSPAITNSGVANVSASSAGSEASQLAAEMRELQKQSVYFDFDKYAVKPEYLEIVRQQAAFIKAHKNDIVTLEGNADERGSAEYNLALGDNRANAVRKNLELLGIPATQIRTVSMGEEKPRVSCHAENCWKENRRDDFVHKLN